MKTKSKFLATILCGGLALAAVPSRADLQIINGNFQASAPGSNTTDVVGWVNSKFSNNWWEGTWYGPGQSPDNTSVMGLGYQNGASAGTNWAYQDIGVNNLAFASITLTLDVGSFKDAGGSRNLGVTLSLYQGPAGLVGTGWGVDGNNSNDIAAHGLTLIDTVSFSTGLLSAGQMLTGLQESLSLATANTTDELYLRIANYQVDSTAPWTAVDNVSLQGVAAVPEPSSFALAALGAVAFYFRRKFARR